MWLRTIISHPLENFLIPPLYGEVSGMGVSGMAPGCRNGSNSLDFNEFLRLMRLQREDELMSTSAFRATATAMGLWGRSSGIDQLYIYI